MDKDKYIKELETSLETALERAGKAEVEAATYKEQYEEMIRFIVYASIVFFISTIVYKFM